MLTALDNISNSLRPPVDAASTDERAELFQYYVQKHLKELTACHNHDLQNTLIPLIKKGYWEKLIEVFKGHQKEPTIHEILNASCHQGKLEIDELVSAYIFLAPAGLRHSYLIRNFDEAFSSKEWNFTGRWNSASSIPENQRFFIQVNTKDMDEKVSSLWKAFFDKRRLNYVIGALSHFYNKDLFLISSAALMRTDLFLKGEKLTFLLGMGRRAHVAFRQLQGKHDISLYSPEQKVIFHGTKSEGLLMVVHDGFHAFYAVRANSWPSSNRISKQEALKLMLSLENILLEKVPKYTNRNLLKTDKAYREIDVKATLEDKTRFILEEACQNIIDSEDNRLVASLEEHLDKVIDTRIDSGLWPNTVAPYHENLNIYLKDIGMEYKKNKFGQPFLQKRNTNLEKNPKDFEIVVFRVAILVFCIFLSFFSNSTMK